MNSSKSSLFTQTTYSIVESIPPSEIPENNNIDDILLNKIKKNIGNKCIEVGFVDADSIKIIKRSIGKINATHFNGTIHYNIQISFDLCVPKINSVISAKVIGKNQAGILCHTYPLQIMLSPENQDHKEIYDQIEKNDYIKIKIIRYKIMRDYDHIRILGKFVEKI